MNNPSAPIDYHALLKRALLSLEKMQAKLDALELAKSEPLAIIGMGCRFPGGADTPEGYWELLREGVDAISEVPAERWDIDAYYDARAGTAGKMNTRYGGFIKEVEQFDPQFFGIAPREAISMDPQQRLVLEVGWEALEHAGQAADKLVGSATGVFIGISNSDYGRLMNEPEEIDTYTSTGISLSIAAGRLSYVLGLQGPSLAVDTACSSSLVAVHLACQSLRNRECGMALAGGVNLILTPLATIALSELAMMAPDGRCKTFAREANGFVRGEGCGLVVLKRLSDAQAAGDRILGLIRGTAINQDGRSSGLTAPNGPAQEAVIRKALADGGVRAEEVSYVEAHGTGTALGDPIEVGALGAVLGEQRKKEEPLMIGSVKTNIGHLEAAAGVSGLMKVVLALQHQEVPPHLHLRERSEHIAWEELGVTVPTERRPWPAGQGGKGRRIAGVSSFGFGGTNAHVVLEEAPEREVVRAEVERPVHLLTLSAKSEVALQEQAQRFSRQLSEQGGESLADICYTANSGRAHFGHRLAVVAKTVGQTSEQLAAFAAGEATAELQSSSVENRSQPRVAFLFTGQGSQYAGMGRELYETQPSFRRRLQECDELLRPHLEQSLLAVMYGGESELLEQTAYTQPALFALEYALAELWRSWGVEPSAVMGHSLGEYVAACVAGVFTLAEGLKLVAARGRLMQGVQAAGGMAAVFAGAEQVRAALAPYAEEVAIAAMNTPGQVVISGGRAAVAAVVERLRGGGVRVEELRVSQAFHSPLMEEILDQFEQLAGEINYTAPQLRIVSNLTGELAVAPDVQQASYWRRHAREAVQFSSGIETLTKLGCGVYLEIGPTATLLGMAKQCQDDEKVAWLPSLRRGREEWQQVFESLGALYVRGVKVNWPEVDGGYQRRRVSLPTYPFQRERFWIKNTKFAKSVVESEDTDASKSLRQSKPHTSADWLYEVEWRHQALPIPVPSFAGKVEREVAQAERVAPQPPSGWLVFSDTREVGTNLAELLDKDGERCLLVYADQNYEFSKHGASRINPGDAQQFERLLGDIRQMNGFACKGVVYLWSLDSTPVAQTSVASLEADQDLGCGGLLHLVQALVKAGASKEEPMPRVWLITQGAQGVHGTQMLEIAQAPLWGFGRVIALEHPEVWGGLIDLDSASPAENAATLLAEIRDSGAEDQIAYRQGKRYVSRLVRSDSDLPNTQPSFRDDGTYLITGGLGGLGLKIARWLVDHGARYLVLTRRTPFPERTRWASLPANDDAWRSITAIKKLESHGASVQVVQADTSDQNRMRELLKHIDSTNRPLRGIVHAAAEISARAVKDMDRNMLMSMLSPKVTGTWVLHELTAEMNLDFFVLFSSISALLGSMHLAHYAAANHFLDAFALYRKALNLPILSINWGRWDDDGLPFTEGKQLNLSQYGLNAMPPEQALAVMGLLIGGGAVQKAVAAVDWSLLKPVYEAKRQRPFLEDLNINPRRSAERAKSIDFRRQLQEAASGKRRELLIGHIQSEVTSVLGFNSDHAVDIKHGFFEIGMDSLTSIELKERLEESLGCSLHPTVVFEYSSVEALAEYLHQEVLAFKASDESVEELPEALSLNQAALKDLSKDDLLAMLAAELGDARP